ncbi:MAG: hypothetical protein RL404_1721 [Pseudomonadota bacterium]
MSLPLPHRAAPLSRRLHSVPDPATTVHQAACAAEHASVERQHRHLNELLAGEPALSALVFQGYSLEELATPYGLQLLKHAVETRGYDPVSVNHGIRRLRLDGYEGEIIWDYPGNQTTIIESDAVTETLERHAPTVAAEVLACIGHADKFPDSDSLTNQNGLWSYRSFYDKAARANPPLQAACPQTAALVDSLRPNLTFGFAFISILEPNTTIATHKGSTSLRQRYHLGIRIPQDGVSRIRIGETWKRWQDGKAFGFNDAIDHEVEHWSAQQRTVLIVDTWSDHVPAAVVDAIRKHPDLLKLAVLSGQGESIAIND